MRIAVDPQWAGRNGSAVMYEYTFLSRKALCVPVCWGLPRPPACTLPQGYAPKPQSSPLPDLKPRVSSFDPRELKGHFDRYPPLSGSTFVIFRHFEKITITYSGLSLWHAYLNVFPYSNLWRVRFSCSGPALWDAEARGLLWIRDQPGISILRPCFKTPKQNKRDNAQNMYICVCMSLCTFVSVFFISCVYILSLHVCVCTICVPGIGGGQNMVLDFLKLELQAVVSYHVGSRSWTQVL